MKTYCGIPYEVVDKLVQHLKNSTDLDFIDIGNRLNHELVTIRKEAGLENIDLEIVGPDKEELLGTCDWCGEPYVLVGKTEYGRTVKCSDPKCKGTPSHYHYD